MGASCAKLTDIATDAEVRAAVQSIVEWEEAQKSAAKATQALKTVRKDSFVKATHDLNHKGGIVERLGGPDAVHDVIQCFYRKLFANAEVRHYFEKLPTDRMRSKQMKFMRYIFGGPGTYTGNLRCIHAQMVVEQGLDRARFQLVQGLLLQTFAELGVAQDVVDEVVSNVEAAREAIFTPNVDELVSAEEMTAAAQDLGHPLVERLGGAEAVQNIVQAFYRKLFRCEELKYFFVHMSPERLRNMQFKFMRYLFAGAASYATTGGNMRCVHARMVKEDGLDLTKFNKVAGMLREVLEDQMVAKAQIKEVMANVDAARQAIFTPGPDERLSSAELVAAAGTLQGQAVARLGPDRLAAAVGALHQRLSGDAATEPLLAGAAEAGEGQAKALQLLACLLCEGEAFTAACARLARGGAMEQGQFDTASRMVLEALCVEAAPQDVIDAVAKSTETARTAIFRGATVSKLPSRPLSRAGSATPAAARSAPSASASPSLSRAASTSAPVPASPKPSLYSRMGGDAVAGPAIDLLFTRLVSDVGLKHVLDGAHLDTTRRQQISFLRSVLGGGSGGSRPGTASGSGSGSGGMTLSLAAAHLAAGPRGLGPAQMRALAGHWEAALKQAGAPADAVSEVVAMQGPGSSLLLPPATAAAAGCPFASLLSADERTLDSLLATPDVAPSGPAPASRPGSAAAKPASRPATASSPPAAKPSSPASKPASTGPGPAASSSRPVSAVKPSSTSTSTGAKPAARAASGSPTPAPTASRPGTATSAAGGGRKASGGSFGSGPRPSGPSVLEADEEALLDSFLAPPVQPAITVQA
ncbi:hypothetical protein HYH03_005532 [Edaphochlamys debaryana]|uniref:Uncharacterized protein n=1 Tax=Edaphochlamys debaryana TaxID=47281 RepID=A0A836C280_9CHLO|nr:hypothetical protein HYH03_005532 [Edaphochlamys debaryana]|eukprot:KAG2496299.1 hypothetical protein HYH03_005532 [Edaphochlamys debaryana]